MPSTSAASDGVSIARHTPTNPQEKELWSRHDTYYSLLGTAFVGALSITLPSAVLLGNLQAIPVAVTKQFVKYKRAVGRRARVSTSTHLRSCCQSPL